jgi:E1-E2 ATPase
MQILDIKFQIYSYSYSCSRLRSRGTRRISFEVFKKRNQSTTATTMNLSKAQKDLLRALKVNPSTGLSSEEAAKRRRDDGAGNTVDPPIKCPGWICCLLPCIKSIPSQRIFLSIQPEDAEVLRDGRWIRYEASSLVRGDVIRLEEGDTVPADCTILELEQQQWPSDNAANSSSDANNNKNNNRSNIPELLVDQKYITGEDAPKSITMEDDSEDDDDTATALVKNSERPEQQQHIKPIKATTMKQLYWGGHIVLGSCIAVCTSVGPNTLAASLIRQRQFPVPTGANSSNNNLLASTRTTPSFDGDVIDEEQGISLLNRQGSNSLS